MIQVLLRKDWTIDCLPMSLPGRLPPIALHNLTVRFLRNGNQFSDSGRCRAALQWAGLDPHRTYMDCLWTVYRVTVGLHCVYATRWEGRPTGTP